MRGHIDTQSALVMISPEDLVPADHPIRIIKKVADEALARLAPRLTTIYSDRGRNSIPPEVLLKAQILIALYSVRSERLFCERLRYDFLFRWFLDFRDAGTTFDATSFTKNRQRLLQADLFEEFFRQVIEQAAERRLLSDEHFTVDGTLIEANASLKSFRRKNDDDPPDGGGASNAEIDFRGEKRCNATHQSTTDPEAKLYRKGKGQPAQLCYIGHVLMENRNGLCTDAVVTAATGTSEREAALTMVRRSTKRTRRVTLGADKGYHAADFHQALRHHGIVPHVAERDGIRPLLDGRTKKRKGYLMSQRKRKRVEEIFGWAKTVAGIAKTRFRGATRVATQFIVALTAYNLVRLARLELQPT